MQTNSGFGRLGYGARVYQEPENDPAAESGPVRRASGALVRITDPPRMVYRSPHAVVPDAESGATYAAENLWQDMFLPDGRLVPNTVYVPPAMHGSALGLGAVELTEEAQSAAMSLTLFAAFGCAFMGVLIGAGTGKNNETLWKRASIAGAIGAGTGLVLAGVAGRTAKLATILRKA